MRHVWEKKKGQVHFSLHMAVITPYCVCKHFIFLYWTKLILSFTLGFEL